MSNLFDYFTRVNFCEKDLLSICSKICKDYKLGSLISYNVIETGYEDFNVKIETNTNKYVVKFFANNRTEENVNHYINVVDIISNNDASLRIPKIYRKDNKILCTYNVDNKKIPFFVMDYIEGNTIYDLDKKIDLKTMLQIVFDILKYNCLNNKLVEYLKSDTAKKFKQYDMWSYENFLQEYEEKSKYLTIEDRELMKDVVDYFKKMKLRYSKYDEQFINESVVPPYMSAHNDFISTNIIIDTKGRPNYIDFSVSSVALNFVDIAIFGCDSVLSKNISAKKYVTYLKIISYILYRAHIMEYNLYPTAVAVQHAIHILIANYYKVCENVNSKENNYFLNLGRKGLKYIISQDMMNKPVFSWINENGWYKRAELSKKSEYVDIKKIINKFDLGEFVEKNLSEYHKLYNENNNQYCILKLNDEREDGYKWLYSCLENLNKNDNLMAISFCNENEWNDSPEEEEWTKLNLDSLNRGVIMKRVFVYPDKYKHLLLENKSIKKFKNSKKTNLEVNFISMNTIKKVLKNEMDMIYPGILVFNNEIAYKDVVGNDDMRGFVISDKKSIEHFKKIYMKIVKECD